MTMPDRNRLVRYPWAILPPISLILLSCTETTNQEPSAEQSYPDRPVTLVVPFPPGGSTYFTAEVVAEQFETALGQEFALEVNSGDYGFNAIRQMLQEPDGYTLMVGNVLINSTSPVFHSDSLDFDYFSEVIPVSRIADFPFVVMTNLELPGESLGDLFEHLGNTTGKLTYGTDFPGTVGDIYMLELARAGGLELQYVATSGANAIFADLVAGTTDIAILNVATATRNIGQFKPLAVTGTTRLANFPDVPTLAEVSEADIGVSLWQGLFAPRGTPQEAIDLLHSTLVERFSNDEVIGAFDEVNAYAVTSESPSQFLAEISVEMELWEAAKAEVLAIPAVERNTNE